MIRMPFGYENFGIVRGEILRKETDYGPNGRIKRIKATICSAEYNELIDGMSEELYVLEACDGDFFKYDNIIKEGRTVSFFFEKKYGKLLIKDLVTIGKIDVFDKGHYFVGYITEPKFLNGNTYVALCVPEKEKNGNVWTEKTKYVTTCFKKEKNFLKKGQLREIMIGNISESKWNEKITFSAPGLFII